MTAPTPDPDVAAVLAEHVATLDPAASGLLCACGVWVLRNSSHREHVAAALAPLLAARDAEAGARALREALPLVSAVEFEPHPSVLGWAGAVQRVARVVSAEADRLAADAPAPKAGEQP